MHGPGGSRLLRGRGPSQLTVEIDEAEEAELASASVADFVEALNAEEREARPDGTRVFCTTRSRVKTSPFVCGCRVGIALESGTWQV